MKRQGAVVREAAQHAARNARAERSRRLRRSRAALARARRPAKGGLGRSETFALLGALAAAAGLALTPWAMRAVERRFPQRVAPRLLAVRGLHRVAPAELARLAREALGGEGAAAEAQLARRLEALPPVAEARVLRLPAGLVLVRLREREAVAAVYGPDETSAGLLADRQGRLFAPAPEAPAPGGSLLRIRIQRPPYLGATQAAVGAALEAARALRVQGLPPAREFVFEPGSSPREAWLRAQLAGWPCELWLPAAAPAAGVARLARLLAAAPGLARGAERIDLRFAGRAILFDVGSREGIPRQRAGAGAPGRSRTDRPEASGVRESTRG